jgi:hypothetical protein
MPAVWAAPNLKSRILAVLLGVIMVTRPAGLEPAPPGLEEQWHMLEGYAGQRLAALPTAGYPREGVTRRATDSQTNRAASVRHDLMSVVLACHVFASVEAC